MHMQNGDALRTDGLSLKIFDSFYRKSWSIMFVILWIIYARFEWNVNLITNIYFAYEFEIVKNDCPVCSVTCFIINIQLNEKYINLINWFNFQWLVVYNDMVLKITEASFQKELMGILFIYITKHSCFQT